MSKEANPLSLRDNLHSKIIKKIKGNFNNKINDLFITLNNDNLNLKRNPLQLLNNTTVRINKHSETLRLRDHQSNFIKTEQNELKEKGTTTELTYKTLDEDNRNSNININYNVYNLSSMDNFSHKKGSNLAQRNKMRLYMMMSKPISNKDIVSIMKAIKNN